MTVGVPCATVVDVSPLYAYHQRDMKEAKRILAPLGWEQVLLNGNFGTQVVGA